MKDDKYWICVITKYTGHELDSIFDKYVGVANDGTETELGGKNHGMRTIYYTVRSKQKAEQAVKNIRSALKNWRETRMWGYATTTKTTFCKADI